MHAIHTAPDPEAELHDLIAVYTYAVADLAYALPAASEGAA